MIQEILTEQYGGELVSGALGHKKLSRNVRRRIRRRLGIIANVGGSKYVQEYIPLSKHFDLLNQADSHNVRSPDSDHYTSSHDLRPSSNSHKSWRIVRLLPKFFHVAPCHTNARGEAEGLGVNRG